MAEYLALPGSPAYSHFRLVELKDAIHQLLPKGPKVQEIRSIHVHYVCPKDAAAAATLRSTESSERKILEKLLVYGDKSSDLRTDPETLKLATALKGEQIKDSKNRLLLHVAPRKGTISPWSSKATSIAHVCGLEKLVQRIERGVLVSIIFESEYKKAGERYPFADELHDRMTQVGPKTTPLITRANEAILDPGNTSS